MRSSSMRISSSSVASDSRTTVEPTRISAVVRAPVLSRSPVVSGRLRSASAHTPCSLSYQDTTPCISAKRPTLPGGSSCAKAEDPRTGATMSARAASQNRPRGNTWVMFMTPQRCNWPRR